MRKTLVLLLLVIAVLTLTVAPGHAHWRGGVYVGVGPYWGPYSYPYYWYPPPYYVYRPPAVVVEEPPVYVERTPATPSAPAEPTAYWYYCASAKGYYPTVPSCAEDWIKVPPR
jgi:hypothetical protein